MYEHLETICRFIDRAKEKYPDTPLENNGLVGYYNGNDGTQFDWECNDRLCEFGCGYDNGEDIYAFKVLVDKDGYAECCCYPNGEQHPVEIIKDRLFTEGEMDDLYEHMCKFYDDRLNWNCLLVDVEE